MPVDYEYTTGWGKSLTDNLIQFMEAHNIRYKGIFGIHQLRFREWFILPDETTYVLGVAKKSGDFLKEQEHELVKRLDELKDDPVKMAKLDLNKDGQVSMEEWDLARRKVEREVLEQALKSSKNPELADVVIGKGETEKTFIISEHSQKGLTAKLSTEANLGIFGGAVLSVVTLWFLLIRFGILRF